MEKTKIIKNKIINLKNIFFIFSFLFNQFNLVFIVYGLNNSSKNMSDLAQKSGYNISNADPELIIGAVIKDIISFLGVIFFVLIVYGGFLWMTSRGNDDQIGKAKKIITTSIIGLIIVMFAYAITWYIIFQLTNITGYQ